MVINRKAGLHLLLIVAAVLGSSASVLSATGPAIELGAVSAAATQAKA